MFQDSYQPGFLLDFSARVVHTARGESGVLCRLWCQRYVRVQYRVLTDRVVPRLVRSRLFTLVV